MIAVKELTSVSLKSFWLEYYFFAYPIAHYEEPISTAMFSPDGRYVITTGADHQARFWYWQTDDLISQANQRLTRDLS